MSGAHPVALAIDYPERPRNRLTTAFRPFVAIPVPIVLGRVSGGSIDWLLALPHYIVAVFLRSGAVVAVVVAWFAIMFTGRYPRRLFDFVVGVGHWHLRVVVHPFGLAP